MKAFAIKRMATNIIVASAALLVLSACSEADSRIDNSASCKLKSYTVEYDKSRMCVYTCKGGELEGRTRSQAQGACLDYVPSAK